jgi:hypothetical protein
MSCKRPGARPPITAAMTKYFALMAGSVSLSLSRVSRQAA